MSVYDRMAQDMVSHFRDGEAPEVTDAALQLARWQADPIAWITERVGIERRTVVWSENPGYDDHVWDGTPDPFVVIAEALAAGQDVGVESGTGTGKTFFGAALALWFHECFEGSEGVTTAPKENQLTRHMWKELGRLWPAYKAEHPQAKKVRLLIRMHEDRDDWSVVGFSCGVGAEEESATKMQGFHNEHMLIQTEETPGIHRAVMTAIENTSTAPHNLRLAWGNPDHQQDSLHKFCLEPDVLPVVISALDHPNVVCDDPTIVPGAVSRKSIRRRARKLGVGSRLYQSRVRGISPAEAEDALIPLAWLQQAVANADLEAFQMTADQQPALGVDVANSPNGDRGAIANGVGPRLMRVNSRPCPDANVLGSDVAALMLVLQVPPDRVGVDGIGVGAGCVNELKRLGKHVVNIQSSGAPVVVDEQEERFLNLRAQMCWLFREDVRNGRLALPDDEELLEDLTALTWKLTAGKIQVIAKDQLRAKLRRSTDKGDAAIYWNWVRQNLVGASVGGALVTF